MNKKLESVQTDTGRYYLSPKTGKWYPSVTTVVNHETEAFWAEWRKDPKNAAISKRACARGNSVHGMVEEYLKEGVVPDGPIDVMRFNILKPYLDRITKIHAIEETLYSDQILMAGRLDCMGDYDGEIAVIDFKTSSKEKTASQIKNYFHQATAYSIMWEEMYGQPVNKIVILILTEEGTLQEFVRDASEYRKSMLKVAKGYWEKNSFKSVQEKANELYSKTAR